MIRVLHETVLALNFFFLVYMAAMQLNQGLLLCLGWHDISDYVKRSPLRDYETIGASDLSVPVSIIVPAYNEEGVIAESVRSLLGCDYVGLEVVVVNDGSSDGTLQALMDAFPLVEDKRVPRTSLPSEPVLATYRSRDDDRLMVIDKGNGGKADALNAGLCFARYPLFCATDSDTVLERDALPRLVREFQVRPETVAVGGIVRILNGSSVSDGHVYEVKTPRNLLVNLQIVEYLRAFLLGRTGWSKLRALLIISGAFGLFRRELVIAAGGYDRTALGEDADLVVRLHRLCHARGIDYRIGFIADPVCWTEAPDNFSVLARQRERWHRGLMQVLWRHRGMIGRPRYGAVGLIAFPYFVIFEALGPVVEVLGYLCFGLSLGLGWASTVSAAAFFFVAICLGTAFSLGSLLVEERAFQRYRGWRCFARLITAAVLENVFYRQWYAVVRVWACFGMAVGKKAEWGEMTRTGFGPSQVAVPLPAPTEP